MVCVAGLFYSYGLILDGIWERRQENGEKQGHSLGAYSGGD